MTSAERDAVSRPGWHWLSVSEVNQDIQGWKDPETGEYFPPTMKWMFTISGLRSDGHHFFVRITLADSEVTDRKQLAATVSSLAKGIVLFEEFRVCQCAPNSKCEKHAEPAKELAV